MNSNLNNYLDQVCQNPFYNEYGYYQTMQVGHLKCNMTIVVDSKTNDAVIVDPGGDFPHIKKLVNSLGVTIKQILITHAHTDHYTAAGEVSAFTGAPILLHKDDLYMWNDIFSEVDYKYESKHHKDPDIFLTDGFKLDVLGGTTILTPGHTQGSCCFYWKKLNLLCSGDTLFRTSIGRTENTKMNSLIKKSIREKLYTLPGDTKVVPGHGGPTVIGIEKISNIFVKENPSRDHYDDDE